jgi:phage terminase large subunit
VASLDLTIPRYFQPRSYQAEFYEAMRAGCKRAALVWHRRAGKDATTLNWTIEAMLRRPGTYYYFLPTYAQSKKILWDGIQADGFPFLRHFPQELVVGKNETEMKITLALPGDKHSTFQLVGADNIDSIVGTNPVGCVFSEYSLMAPRAWDMMRPILAENGGWSVFVFTPRGRNWAAELWASARTQAEWFTSIKDVTVTRRDGPTENGGEVVPMTAIEQERRDGMAEELIQQEFYCSFEGAMQGAYYGDLIERMRKEGRITACPYNADLLVNTSWDLGVDDETVIGFWQTETNRVTGRMMESLIDIEVGSGAGLDYYWRLMNQRPYTYGRNFAPHDMKVQEFGTGNTRLQTASRMGLHFEVVPKIGIADGINATRRMLPHLWVDEEVASRTFGKAHTWLNAMTGYRRDFDERTQTFRNIPKHDWTSHFADMTRYRATMFQGRTGLMATRPINKPDRAQDADWGVFDREDDSGPLAGAHSRTDWGRFGA